MKALIISEDEKVYSVLNSVLQKAGYETIIYKWLLKALDNIEEIRPDCIVVSSSEYPRHWKTLVQFVKSGIGGDDVEIYLYEPNPMSDEDEEKARVLGITDYFTELDTAVLEQKFCKLEPEVPTVSNIVEDSQPPKEEEKAEIPSTGHFMFTNPVTNKYVWGKFLDYNGTTLSCSVKNADCLDKNKEIEYFTFFDTHKTRMAKVIVNDVVKVDSTNSILVIEIKEVYEEN